MWGLDATFLVEVEVVEAPRHESAIELLHKKIALGEVPCFALAPQVLTEFIHVVTDGNRFEKPLDMKMAIDRAELWWDSREVERVVPGIEASSLFLHWMRAHSLGRKRLLDTYLAATYASHGIREIASSDNRDFAVFDFFELIIP